MSNRNERGYNNGNQNNETKKESEREPYSIEVEKADFADRAPGLNDFWTSFELCELVNSIMRPAFDDYEGSTFEVDQAGNPIINLWFNHRSYGEDAIVAFSQSVEADKYKNSTLARVKQQNKYYREGNSYNITMDGKDVIGKFIYHNFKDRSGKVKWNNITEDVAQPNNMREVLSKVGVIDPVKIIEERFGVKTENDIEYAYSVSVVRSLAATNFVNSASAGWLLNIQQINKTQLDRALRNAGIVNPNGLGIVR